jgi:hypothetical protein
MTTIKTLAEDNVRYLHQALILLESIPDENYSRPAPLNMGSSIGAHLRHCIDHYDNFMAGIAAGRIDYDARRREQLVETSRTVGMDKLKSLIAGLHGVSVMEDKKVSVKMDCGGEQAENLWWTDSSIRRELQFMISHTVHHFAIIKMTLAASGITVGADFGIAPSTLRYHQGASACAH